MKIIKIKLKRIEADSLQQFLDDSIAYTSADITYNEILVRELIGNLIEQLGKMLNNAEQKKFTLKLDGAHCLGFLMYVHQMDLRRFPYEGQLIRRIIEQIDRNRNFETI